MKTEYMDVIDMTEYMENFDNILAAGNEPNMAKQYNPQVAYRMAKYFKPEYLKMHVLQSDKLQQLLKLYALKGDYSLSQIKSEAERFLNDIALDRNLTIIRWCGLLITYIGKRICTGIFVNRKNLNEMKKSLGKYPVLFLPSHRSYMDFILLSYVFFHFNIEIPGIATGMDFYSMFGLSTILRKTGAFFMRRSFSKNDLYWDVFREFIYALISFYHSGVEFFIEGTRSRNFKALVPKIGLLSMTLSPYFMGEVADIIIVPISVSYERVLEEQLFVYELLGVPKPKESTRGFFKALKIIDECFGNMYMDFGQPISVKEFFGDDFITRRQHTLLPADTQQLNTKQVDLIKRLANEITYQQQRYIVINTFSLLCLYYSSQIYQEIAVTIDDLCNHIQLLCSLFKQLQAHVSTNLNDIKFDIMQTVQVHHKIVHWQQSYLQLTRVSLIDLNQEIDANKLKGHTLSVQTMAIAVPSLSLQLYVNPCLFWLARPSYLILAALQLQNEIQNNQCNLLRISEYELKNNLFQRTSTLENIFKNEFIIDSNRQHEDFENHLQLLQDKKMLQITWNENHKQIAVHITNEYCVILLTALAPFLCLYYQLTVTINELFRQNCHTFATKELLIRVQERIERLLQQNSQQHVHPYCLALDNLNIAISSLIEEGYLIKKRRSGELQIAVAVSSGQKCLIVLERQLYEYCNLLPFRRYYDYYKKELISPLSKL